MLRVFGQKHLLNDKLSSRMDVQQKKVIISSIDIIMSFLSIISRWSPRSTVTTTSRQTSGGCGVTWATPTAVTSSPTRARRTRRSSWPTRTQPRGSASRPQKPCGPITVRAEDTHQHSLPGLILFFIFNSVLIKENVFLGRGIILKKQDSPRLSKSFIVGHFVSAKNISRGGLM